MSWCRRLGRWWRRLGNIELEAIKSQVAVRRAIRMTFAALDPSPICVEASIQHPDRRPPRLRFAARGPERPSTGSGCTRTLQGFYSTVFRSIRAYRVRDARGLVHPVDRLGHALSPEVPCLPSGSALSWPTRFSLKFEAVSLRSGKLAIFNPDTRNRDSTERTNYSILMPSLRMTSPSFFPSS